MQSQSVKVEDGVGAMSLSPWGKDLALASRSGLYILNPQDVYSLPKFLPLGTTWEVADAQWCPNEHRNNVVASTSNQKILVWDLDAPSDNAIKHVLHGHQRVVTAIDFSVLHADTLASCSIDTFVHVWDLREPARPVLSFADFHAGAGQVKWSKVNEYILASSHDYRVCIWDSRKANICMNTFKGHSGRVNCVEFNSLYSDSVISCSTDRSIRFWDINTLSEQCGTLHTAFPVWRIRGGPTGMGILIAPLRGGSNQLFYSEMNKKMELEPLLPVVSYASPIKDVVWRKCGDLLSTLTLTRDGYLHAEPFDLIVDGKSVDINNATDFSFEVLDPVETRKPVYTGYPNDSIIPHVTASKTNCRYKTQFAELQFGAHPDKRLTGIAQGKKHFASDMVPMTLREEVAACSSKFPRVCFEIIDVTESTCVLTVEGPWGSDDRAVSVRVRIQYPQGYPNVPLAVLIENNSHIPETKQAEIEDCLNLIVEKCAINGERALEFCLRYLVGESVQLREIEDLENTHRLSDFFDGRDLFDRIDMDVKNIRDEIANEDPDSDSDLDIQSAHSSFMRPSSNQFGPNSSQFKLDATPIPVLCGAVWSSKGILVCFFNPKARKKHVIEPLPLEHVFSREQEQEVDVFVSDCESEVGGLVPSKILLFAPTQFAHLDHQEDYINSNTSAREPHEQSSEPTKCSVLLVDLTYMCPSNYELACNYENGWAMNAIETARHNARVAKDFKRKRDSYFWTLLSFVLGNDAANCDIYSEGHFCKTTHRRNHGKCIDDWSTYLLAHLNVISAMAYDFEKEKNIQALAELACTLLLAYRDGAGLVNSVKSDLANLEISDFESRTAQSSNFLPVLKSEATEWEHTKKSSSLTRQFHVVTDNLSFLANSEMKLQRRSLSFTKSRQNPVQNKLTQKTSSTPSKTAPKANTKDIATREYQITLEWSMTAVEGPLSCKDESLLSPSPLRTSQEFWKHLNISTLQYASMLQTWGLDTKRLEVLNLYETGTSGMLVLNSNKDVCLSSIDVCNNAESSKSSRIMICIFCKQFISLQFAFCLNCCHAMHPQCSKQWWERNNECPSGCGCDCLKFL